MHICIKTLTIRNLMDLRNIKTKDYLVFNALTSKHVFIYLETMMMDVTKAYAM